MNDIALEARPAWIEALAEACERTSQARVADHLCYSTSVISQVLNGSYRGNLPNIQRKVEGAYMGRCVECPILGQIALNVCIDNQGRPFAATNSQRVRLYRACRNGCEHSRLSTQGGNTK